MKGVTMAALLHAARFATADKYRQRRVDHPESRKVAPPSPVWHGCAMRGTSGKAGGFFLMVGILAGLVAGVILGNTMAGVLAGTAGGAALAALTWLIDRRRPS